jgi:hypothetical protein
MTMIDVALAPAGKTGFHRAKSDLRWLEAGALGIPVIASPELYHDIEHGVTGSHARNAPEAKAILRIASSRTRRCERALGKARA